MANSLTSFLLPQTEVKNQLTIAEKKSCRKIPPFNFECTTDTGVLTLGDTWVALDFADRFWDCWDY